MVIIDRSDTGAGNFDFEFNYDQIQWETGGASGGSNGLGGSPARGGYSNGSTTSFELQGSGVSGAFLDGGSKSLVQNNQINSGLNGRDIFNVRNGLVNDTTQTPLPPSIFIVGGGLLAYGASKLRRRPIV